MNGTKVDMVIVDDITITELDCSEETKQNLIKLNHTQIFKLYEHEFMLHCEDIHPPRLDPDQMKYELKKRKKRAAKKEKAERKQQNERFRQLQAYDSMPSTKRPAYDIPSYYGVYKNKSCTYQNKGNLSKKARRSL